MQGLVQGYAQLAVRMHVVEVVNIHAEMLVLVAMEHVNIRANVIHAQMFVLALAMVPVMVRVSTLLKEKIQLDLSGNLKNIISKMKKLVGQVTEEEKNEIQTLFERRNGLNELAKILTPENEALYEKLVKDMGETGAKFQNWWDRMGEKYQWESTEGGNWEINFETCDIYLVDNN